MRLELLDIDEFIQKKKLKQITTVRLYEKIGKLEPSGLFSEEIFGKFGSTDRRHNFGYVDLKVKIIHPEVYPIINGLDTTISKLIGNKARYIIDKDGFLIESPTNGSSGIRFFINNYDKINMTKFKRSEVLNFLKKNINKIFIDKYIILPAGIRDIVPSQTKQNVINFAELSEMYGNLIRHTNVLGSDIESLPEEIVIPIIEQIQKTVIEINTWIKDRLNGKFGLIRGGLLKKVIDYSGRLVIITDNNLLLGTIGLPWQVVLKLYEPFAINYILKKDKNILPNIQYLLKMNEQPDVDDLKRLFKTLIDSPDIITPDMLNYFTYVANEIVKDKYVIYKRDPVNDRSHWMSANIRVDKNSTSMMINPFDLDKCGGDHDGDTMCILPLFTKEAQQEAKEKMHPQYTKSSWVNVILSSKCPYKITGDAAVAIYAATK